MSLSKRNFFLVAALLLFLTCTFFCKEGSAQIGLKVAQARPMSDFGATFKKAPSFELIFHQRYFEGKLFSRAVFSYSRFQPREDTIPVYLVEFRSPYIVYPGALVYQDMDYFGLTIDHQLRIIKNSNFELLAGGGLSLMKANLIYNLSYETKQNTSTVKKDFVVGLNACASAMYHFNGHFAAFADIQFQTATFTDWSIRFPNRKIGIGFLYTINEDDDE